MRAKLSGRSHRGSTLWETWFCDDRACGSCYGSQLVLFEISLGLKLRLTTLTKQKYGYTDKLFHKQNLTLLKLLHTVSPYWPRRGPPISSNFTRVMTNGRNTKVVLAAEIQNKQEWSHSPAQSVLLQVPDRLPPANTIPVVRESSS